MLLWWGPRLTQLDNDAFTPLIGDKHPRAIGQDAVKCYPEAWSELGPPADSGSSALVSSSTAASALRLAASFGLAADVLRGRSPTSESVNQRVLASGRTEMASGIRQRIGPVIEPVEPGGAVADSAVVLPLTDRCSGRTAARSSWG